MYFNDYEIGISSLIHDFREGELPITLDANHVDRWIHQFDEKDRSIILAETFHVLNNSYYKKDRITAFCKRVLKCLSNIASLAEYAFIANQSVGESQKRLLGIIRQIARTEYNTDIHTTDECDYTEGMLVYVDDGLYTGRRIRQDLYDVINKTHNKVIVVFLIAAYTNNLEYCKKKLSEIAEKSRVTIVWKIETCFENIKCEKKHFDTVWPHDSVLNDAKIKEYAINIASGRNMSYITHDDSYDDCLFSNKEAARIIENAFLTKGFEILANVQETQFRPLGFDTNVSFGFGSFFATDINISNTCPLVLWWGALKRTGNQALDCWYPLLPRRSNGELLNKVLENQKKHKLVNYSDVLLATYKLAIERAEHEKNNSFSICDFSLEELYKRRENDELLKFLYNLNLDQVKIIGTMMYIGRDFTIDSSTDYYNELEDYIEDNKLLNREPYPVRNPEVIVEDYMQDLEETFGDDKYKWVEQIHQKIPLNRYLKSAFYKMGIL